MRSYVATILHKDDSGWSLISTTEQNLTNNPGGVGTSVLRKAFDAYFQDDEDLPDNTTMERLAKSIASEIESRVYGTMTEMIDKALFDKMRDVDWIDGSDIDADEIAEWDITVNTEDLADEIKDNLMQNEYDYTEILNVHGILMYDVRDPDMVVVGRIVLTALQEI